MMIVMINNLEDDRRCFLKMLRSSFSLMVGEVHNLLCLPPQMMPDFECEYTGTCVGVCAHVYVKCTQVLLFPNICFPEKNVLERVVGAGGGRLVSEDL